MDVIKSAWEQNLEELIYQLNPGCHGSSVAILKYRSRACVLFISDFVTYSYACRNIVNTIMTNGHSSLEKYTLYSKWYERVTKGLCVRGELETEHNCNILTPSSSGYYNTSFSFSWAAQSGALRAQPLLGPGSHFSNCNN